MYSRSIPALSARNRVVNESRAVLTAALSSVTYPPLGIRRLAVSRQTIISKNLPQEKPFYLVLDKDGPVGQAASDSHVCRSFLFSFTGQADVLFKLADNRLAPEAGRSECLYNNTGLEWDGAIIPSPRAVPSENPIRRRNSRVWPNRFTRPARNRYTISTAVT